MNKIIIIGSGGQCRSVISILKSTKKWHIKGIIDLSFRGQNEVIMGVPVLGGLEAIMPFKYSGLSVALAFGDNSKREKVAGLAELDNFEYPNIVHHRAFVDSTVKLGQGNIIGCFAFVGPKVTIEDFNIINTSSIVEHESAIGSYNHIAPSATVCGRVKINDFTLIGANATVLPGLSVASHIKLGANSTADKTIVQENQTLIGNPARAK